MLVRTAREVALLVRDRRRALGLTQAALAERVGASREWVRLLETGKPRLELALTLRALTALGITLDARSEGPAPAPPPAPAPAERETMSRTPPTTRRRVARRGADRG